MIVQNGVCVIVQARLGSKRLPKKAILNLDDKNLLEHVLRSLTSVDAQLYILACDYASEKVFYPIAEKYNFFFAARRLYCFIPSLLFEFDFFLLILPRLRS